MTSRRVALLNTWPPAGVRVGVTLIALVALLVAGCTRSTPDRAAQPGKTTPKQKVQSEINPLPLSVGEATLYGLGLSTDPYGVSRPRGIGVVKRLGNGAVHSVRLRRKGLRPDTWIDQDSILAIQSRKSGARQEILRYKKGGFKAQPPPPLPSPVWDFAWSPDRKLIAFEPIQRTKTGYTASLRIMIERSNGSDRREVASGSLAGWTPDGRVMYMTGAQRRFDRRGHLMALDLKSGQVVSLMSGQEVADFARRPGAVELGNPIFSADERFFVLQASVVWGKGDTNRFTLLICRADGTPVRFITSRLAISMFAWSPEGHRLAYTTSGFPLPHQLLVLDDPRAEPRKLLSEAAHFDWVSWSPDGRLLLVDDEPKGRWLVIDSQGERPHRSVTRLGGAPLWCCPANEFLIAF